MSRERVSREERMSEIQEKLEAGVREIFESGKYEEYIAAMSKFPHYSINNCILIVSQCPEASHVCGFRKWQTDFNRVVNRNEHGIMIIAPITYKADVEEPVFDSENHPVVDADGNYIDNWQIQRMTRELNETAYVYELVHFYSNGRDDVESAKQEILRRKQQLSEEMKALRENIKRYQPITNLYEEMKKHMVKAYLFDSYGKTEYVADFIKYRELADTLLVSYGKTVEEVADFIADQRGQLCQCNDRK